MTITIGWDLGGAHLKAAALDQNGTVLDALQLPCPLWLGLDHLDSAMTEALARLPSTASHGITMTGELADIFSSRAEGVAAIADLCQRRLGQDAFIWAGAAGFIHADQAARHWPEVASANWLATVHFLARTHGDFLLFDMGSTTTDLIAVRGGHVLAVGYDDGSRLLSQELVYTGVARTPVMALARRILFQGFETGVAAELFATTADLYLLTGQMEAAASQYPTADGKGYAPGDCARRLARMIGLDSGDAPLDLWRDLASAFIDAQLSLVIQASSHQIERAGLPPEAPLIAAGVGAFNAASVATALNRPWIRAGELLRLEPAARQWAEVALTAVAVAALCLALTHERPDTGGRQMPPR